MLWRNPTDQTTEAAEGLWYAEERDGRWWLYRAGRHVGTQPTKGAAQRLAERLNSSADGARKEG